LRNTQYPDASIVLTLQTDAQIKTKNNKTTVETIQLTLKDE